MRLKLPKLDPALAYLSTSLFIPRSAIVEGPIRRALTFEFDNEERELAVTHPYHLEVPRNYIVGERLQRLGVPVVDLRPHLYERTSLRPKDNFEFRPVQKPAWKALLPASRNREDGILRLDTGQGKTVMGLRYAAEVGGPLLVVSWQKAHLGQWGLEIDKLFHLDTPVGWIGDGKMEYDREVVFSTVQTLAKLVDNGGLPQDFSTRFALAIYDEVHHQAARWFCKASDITTGQRLGLTATLKRRDRCEGIVLAHIGKVLYNDPSEHTLVPTVHLHDTDIELDDDDPDVLDVTGEFNVSRLRSKLASIPVRNRRIVACVQRRLRQGHKVYLVSHIKDHVYLLVRMLGAKQLQPGIITGDEKKAEERLWQLRNHDVVVATMNVGKESYNRPELSAVVLATPFSIDPYAPTEWTQVTGRALRPLAGKLDPVVDVFLDRGVTRSRGMTMSIVNWCSANNWPIEGDEWRRSSQARVRRAFTASSASGAGGTTTSASRTRRGRKSSRGKGGRTSSP